MLDPQHQDKIVNVFKEHAVDKLQYIMSLKYKSVDKLVEDTFNKIKNGEITDLQNMPVLFDRSEVEKMINPVILQTIRGLGPDYYGEFLKAMQTLDDILIVTLQRLAFSTMIMGGANFVEVVKANNEACNNIYGRDYFDVDIMEDKMKQLRKFDINDFKK